MSDPLGILTPPVQSDPLGILKKKDLGTEPSPTTPASESTASGAGTTPQLDESTVKQLAPVETPEIKVPDLSAEQKIVDQLGKDLPKPMVAGDIVNRITDPQVKQSLDIQAKEIEKFGTLGKPDANIIDQQRAKGDKIYQWQNNALGSINRGFYKISSTVLNGLATVAYGYAKSTNPATTPELMDPVRNLADQYDKFVDDIAYVDPDKKDNTVNSFFQSLGTALGFAAGGSIDAAMAGADAIKTLGSQSPTILKHLADMGSSVVGNMAGLSMAGEGFKEAKDKGATDTQALVKSLTNYGIGMTYAIPISRSLSRINEVTKGGLMPWMEGNVKGATDFGIQSAVVKYLSNVADNAVFNEGKSVLDGIVGAGLNGYAVGFALNSLLGVGALLPPEKQAEWEKLRPEIEKAVDENKKATDQQAGDIVEQMRNQEEPKFPEGILPQPGSPTKNKSGIVIYRGQSEGNLPFDIHGGIGRTWTTDREQAIDYTHEKGTLRSGILATDSNILKIIDPITHQENESDLRILSKIVGIPYEELSQKPIYDLWKSDWTQKIKDSGYDAISTYGIDGPEVYVLNENKITESPTEKTDVTKSDIQKVTPENVNLAEQKPEENAIQKQGTDESGVRGVPGAGNEGQGGPMGEGNTIPQEPAGTRVEGTQKAQEKTLVDRIISSISEFNDPKNTAKNGQVESLNEIFKRNDVPAVAIDIPDGTQRVYTDNGVVFDATDSPAEISNKIGESMGFYTLEGTPADTPNAAIQPDELKLPVTDQTKERKSRVVQSNKGRLSDDVINYHPTTNKETISKANDLIDKYGTDDTESLFYNNQSGMDPTLRSVMGDQLAKRLSAEGRRLEKAGDPMAGDYYRREMAVINKQADLRTQAGQYLQAGVTFEDASPTAKVMEIQDGQKQARARKVKQNQTKIDRAKTELDKVNADVADELTKTNKKTKADLYESLKRRQESRDLKIKLAIERLNKLKINPNGQVNDVSFVIGAKLYNEAIDKISEVLEAYGDIVKAIDAAVTHIKANYKDDWKEKEFRNMMFNAAGKVGNEPYSPLVKKGLKDMEQRMDEIVKQHYGKQQIVKDDLTRNLMDQLGISEADAKDFTDQIDRQFNKLATERKQKVIERTLGRKKLKNAKSLDVQAVIEASNLGILDEKAFRDQYADLVGWPKLTDEQATKIRDMAIKADEAHEGMPKREANHELMKYISTINGLSWSDMGTAIWYTNMLSGFSTLTVNPYANQGQIFGEAWITGQQELLKKVMHGTGMSPTALMNAWYNSIPNAVESAMEHIKTGNPLGKGDMSKFGMPSQMESYPKLLKGGEYNPFSWMRFVSRILGGQDIFAYRQLHGMRDAQLATELAYKRLGKDVKTKDIVQEVNKILGNTSEQIAEYRQQAKDEGYAEGSQKYNLRVWELQELGMPEEIRADANSFSAHGTYNYTPEGSLGIMVGLINQLSRKIPHARAVVPFTTVVANVANEYLNWTPIGTARYLKGGIGWNRLLGQDVNYKTEFKGDQGVRTLLKSMNGMMAFAGMWYLHKSPNFEITASGPKDREKQYELMQSGWQPYSIRIGNEWVSYQHSPIGAMFAIAGALADQEKYENDAQKGALKKATLAILAGAQYWGDMTFLQSMNDFMGSFNSNDPLSAGQSKMLNFLKRTGKSLIVTNVFTQSSQIIQEIFDMPMKKASGFYDNLVRDMPVLRDSQNNIYNALGEPVTPKILEKLIPSKLHKAEYTGSPAWKLIVENQAWIGAPGKQGKAFFPNEGEYGTKRLMTDQEYNKYALLSGIWTRKLLEGNMDEINKTIKDNNLDGDQRKELIYRYRDAARKIAEAQLFAGLDVSDLMMAGINSRNVSEIKAETQSEVSKIK